MLRIGAIFIGVCMVLIAASLGAVLFLKILTDRPFSRDLIQCLSHDLAGIRVAERKRMNDVPEIPAPAHL